MKVGHDATIDLGAISPTEETFVYLKYYSNTDVRAFLVRNGKEVELFKSATKDYVVNSIGYIDSDTLLMVTNFESERFHLISYNIETLNYDIVFSHEEKDVTNFDVDTNSGTLYCLTSAGVIDELWMKDSSRKEFLSIDFPGSLIWDLRVSMSGNLYAIISDENSPQNILYRDFSGKWTRLTENKVMGIDSDELICSKIISYETYDGKMIEALWYEADSKKSNGYTIIMSHGGPQAADRKSYWSFTQALLYRGYNIFTPNFRGSTGYGAEFTKLVEKDWGGGPRLDIIKGIEYLVDNNLVHKDKLFAFGISYGGYMTLLLHGLHSELFQAFVDISGPTNLLTFIDFVPDYWKSSIYNWVGHPEIDKKLLIESSPVTYVENMNKPILIIQGAKDERVIKNESDQLVELLRQNGSKVEYLVIPDEGHNFTKKENEFLVFNRVIQFFDSQILN